MLASGLFDSDICLTPVSRDANVGIRSLERPFAYGYHGGDFSAKPLSLV